MKNGKKNLDPLRIIGRAKGYTHKELIDGISRHSDYSPTLAKKIKNLPEVLLRNSGSPLAKKLVRMTKEVFKEAYRAKQFTRTEINDRGVLYGVVLFEHNVMDLVLLYFHQRWPQCVVCLYNEKSQKTGIINEKGIIREVSLPLDQIVRKISEKRPSLPYFEDIQFSGKEIFETLYKSQNIVERENPHYFKSMIPEYCYKLPGMRNGVERGYTSKNKKIDQFF
ncbi:MAG: DUF4130 domain-containing protein [Candidatus Lokiarchaeota archaeon]|nr:DUF4130 domain-containing protein [Candidatus Lokiarchaeota archaeon]